MTHEQKILEYMEKHGSITPLEAVSKLGCLRLSARIADLRAQGVEIVTEMVSVKNRFGKTCHVARYSLA